MRFVPIILLVHLLIHFSTCKFAVDSKVQQRYLKTTSSSSSGNTNSDSGGSDSSSQNQDSSGGDIGANNQVMNSVEKSEDNEKLDNTVTYSRYENSVTTYNKYFMDGRTY